MAVYLAEKGKELRLIAGGKTKTQLQQERIALKKAEKKEVVSG